MKFQTGALVLFKEPRADGGDLAALVRLRHTPRLALGVRPTAGATAAGRRHCRCLSLIHI